MCKLITPATRACSSRPCTRGRQALASFLRAGNPASCHWEGPWQPIYPGGGRTPTQPAPNQSQLVLPDEHDAHPQGRMIPSLGC